MRRLIILTNKEEATLKKMREFLDKKHLEVIRVEDEDECASHEVDLLESIISIIEAFEKQERRHLERAEIQLGQCKGITEKGVQFWRGYIQAKKETLGVSK